MNIIGNLESIVKKVKIWALAGITSLAIGCAPLPDQYIEPKAGLVCPVAEEEKDYDASFAVGVSYGFDIERVRNLGLEANLDYFRSSEQYIETDSFLLRVDAVYQSKSIGIADIYFTGGLAFLSEFSDIDIPAMGVHDEKSSTSVGIGVGINTLFDRIDAKFNYIMMIGSENVKGIIVLTAGYWF